MRANPGRMTTARGSETVERLLLERARRGDRGAFGALYQEHATEAWRLALAVGRQPMAAGDAVAEAFGKVLAPADRRSSDRQLPARLSLLAATRNAAVDAHRLHERGPSAGTTGDLAVAGAAAPTGLGRTAVHTEVVVQSFKRLPERWRSALWLIEVEGLDPGEAGIVLGISAQGIAQLAGRAHAGLREQFAQAQVRSATEANCQRTALCLGGYVTNTLSTRDATRVRRHLDRCAACRDRLDELDDLAPRLRRGLPALPLVVFGAAEQAWATNTTRSAGPLGLTWPGGRPLAPWAERALAGATAAVITLGITGAILAGGRGSKDRGDQLTGDAVAQPVGTPDGESALGRADGPIGGSGASNPRPDDTSTTSSAATPAPVPAASGDPSPASSRDEAPRGGGSPTPTGPSPTEPSGPVDPEGPDPVAPPPSDTPPVVTIRPDDSTGVSVGGTCTGAELLDIVVGCEPGASTAPMAAAPTSGPLLGL